MVMSYTQLLERDYKGRLDPPADKFIPYAVEGAHRMETLLRDLREYWSANEQKLDGPISPIDCNEVVDKAIHLLEVAIQESGAQITREALPRIIVEAVPFTLLFQNLLSNAIKYRRPDELPTIHISAEKRKHIVCLFSRGQRDRHRRGIPKGSSLLSNGCTARNTRARHGPGNLPKSGGTLSAGGSGSNPGTARDRSSSFQSRSRAAAQR